MALARLPHAFSQNMDGAGRTHFRTAADHMGQADFGTLNLARAGFTAQMQGYFVKIGDAGCAERMAF